MYSQMLSWGGVWLSFGLNLFGTKALCETVFIFLDKRLISLFSTPNTDHSLNSIWIIYMGTHGLYHIKFQ